MRLFLSPLIALLTLTGPVRADEVRYLPTAQLALTEYATTLLSAQKSIDLAYYIYDPCSISGGLIDKILFQKVKSGVRVRILVDAEGYGEQNRRDLFAAAFAARGIEVRFFNSSTSHWNVLSNNRIHAKLLLVDGKTYITGGRNIGDDYFSLAEAVNFVDRDVRITGGSARQAAQGFETLWRARAVYREAAAKASDLSFYQRTCLSTADNADVQKFIFERANETLAANPSFTCANVEFHVDDPAFVSAASGENESAQDSYLTGDRYQLKHATRAIVDELKNVRQSLTLENWGYIPAGRIETELDRIRGQRLPIALFTNKGVGQVDDYSYLQNYYIARDSKGSQKSIALSLLGSLQDKWTMTPLTARFFIHSKVFVIDERDSVVGSFNIDPRSYHTNVESTVVVRNCPALAAHVVNEMKKQLTTAYQKDRSCQACQTPAKLSDAFGPVRAWLGKEFQ